MKPIGPLMWEHRLIEKMLASMMRHIDQVEKSKKVNPLIIDMAVDFVLGSAYLMDPRVSLHTQRAQGVAELVPEWGQLIQHIHAEC